MLFFLLLLPFDFFEVGEAPEPCEYDECDEEGEESSDKFDSLVPIVKEGRRAIARPAAAGWMPLTLGGGMTKEECVMFLEEMQ